MKKRTILLPFSAFMLMSCSHSSDVRNKYPTREDCLRDNPHEEIRKNLDEDDRKTFNPTHLCEQVTSNGQTYFLGPSYPHSYYGHSGFYQGYWMGRYGSYGTYSSGVVYQNGQSFTHSEIASKGGISNVVSKSASGTTVSRGGFGSRGSSSMGS